MCCINFSCKSSDSKESSLFVNKRWHTADLILKTEGFSTSQNLLQLGLPCSAWETLCRHTGSSHIVSWILSGSAVAWLQTRCSHFSKLLICIYTVQISNLLVLRKSGLGLPGLWQWVLKHWLLPDELNSSAALCDTCVLDYVYGLKHNAVPKSDASAHACSWVKGVNKKGSVWLFMEMAKSLSLEWYWRMVCDSLTTAFFWPVL